ncbi:DUF2059 domain-containing protein [Aquimarina celericrescens]|nr:DUF2059 domain-containing protein [Aquimarina celericrescens]
MKKTFLLLFAFLIFISTSFAQEDAEYDSVLKTMFEVSGTEESYSTAIKGMFDMYKKQYTNVDASVWDEFEQDFLQTSLDDLVIMLAPIYKKYMTKDDLEKLISFYETPVGQKFAKNTPLIMQESMQVGQAWGQKIGQQFEQKMKEKGY